MMEIHDFLSRLKGTKKHSGYWTALCPAHNDKEHSFDVKPRKGGGVSFTCRVGCDFKDVLSAMGLSSEDFFGKEEQQARLSDWDIIEAYSYKDESGKEIYQRTRRRKKSLGFGYRITLPNGEYKNSLRAGWFERSKSGTWYAVKDDDKNPCCNPDVKPCTSAVWFDEFTRRALYGLPELLTLPVGSEAWLVEGEKDRDNARKLGFAVFTSGAVGDWRSEYAEYFKGKHLVIFADNDPAGREAARREALDCFDLAESVKIINLPGLPHKGDISDWIENCTKEGRTKEEIKLELRGIVDAAPLWSPSISEKDEDLAKPLLGQAERSVSRSARELNIEIEDLPITEDGESTEESKLRSLARDSARITNIICLLFAHLGFQSDHSRIREALTAFASKLPNPFGWFDASHPKIYDKYRRDKQGKEIKPKSKAALVGADISKLNSEQLALGYIVLDYIPGKQIPDSSGELISISSRFRLRFWRYVLAAVKLSDDARRDGLFQRRYLADEWAVEQIALMIPRRSDVVEVRTEKEFLKVGSKAAVGLARDKRNLTDENLAKRARITTGNLKDLCLAYPDTWAKIKEAYEANRWENEPEVDPFDEIRERFFAALKVKAATLAEREINRNSNIEELSGALDLEAKAIIDAVQNVFTERIFASLEQITEQSEKVKTEQKLSDVLPYPDSIEDSPDFLQNQDLAASEQLTGNLSDDSPLVHESMDLDTGEITLSAAPVLASDGLIGSESPPLRNKKYIPPCAVKKNSSCPACGAWFDFAGKSPCCGVQMIGNNLKDYPTQHMSALSADEAFDLAFDEVEGIH